MKKKTVEFETFSRFLEDMAEVFNIPRRTLEKLVSQFHLKPTDTEVLAPPVTVKKIQGPPSRAVVR